MVFKLEDVIWIENTHIVVLDTSMRLPQSKQGRVQSNVVGGGGGGARTVGGGAAAGAGGAKIGLLES